MKRTMPIVLILLMVLGIGCELNLDSGNGFDNIDPCIWDKEISKDTANEIFDNWINKWDSNGPIPPDSFFINRESLESLVTSNNYCGFRAYYGLTTPGDMRTMGLVIAAINDCDTDMLFGTNDIILFTNMTKASDSLNSPGFKPRIIPLDTAKKFNRNWRQYNEVCLQSDVLGNQICDSTTLNRIPKNPRGIYNPNITQVVPLGLTFTGTQLFGLLAEENNNANAYVFYNCMYSMARKRPGQGRRKINGYRYDLYIRGYGPSKTGKIGPIDILKTLNKVDSQKDFAVDISGGCPFMCDDQDALQAN